MPLPKTSSFKQSITLPSKKNIKMRPFVGREEKALLTAKMTGDKTTIFNTIIEILSSCTDTDVGQMHKPDLEFLFLKSYEMSVSNEIAVSFVCESCKESIQVSIPVTEVTVPVEIEVEHKINVGKDENKNDIVVVLSPPIMQVISDSQDDENLDMIILFNSLRGVYVGNDKVDTTYEEFSEWCLDQENLYMEALKYLNSLPTVQYSRDWECQKCNHKNSVVLEGLSDFFTS